MEKVELKIKVLIVVLTLFALSIIGMSVYVSSKIGIRDSVVIDTYEGTKPFDPIPPKIYQDEQFLAWLYVKNKIVTSELNKIVDTLEAREWSLLERYARNTKNLLDNELRPECASFVLSPGYEDIQYIYGLALKEMSLGMMYTKFGAENMLDGHTYTAASLFDTATSHVDKAIGYINQATSMIENLG